jgi:biotin-dependent carboxylase-like uncharacterized protein
MIEIIHPGPLATVQDLGRSGALIYGVPRGGAMDIFALQAANLLVGNPPDAAAIELTAGGELRFLAPSAFALAGADLAATLDGRPAPSWATAYAPAGARLRLAGRRGGWGARAYLALAGGIDVPLVLGARGTSLSGGFGGLGGRALAKGDQLRALPAGPTSPELLARRWPAAQRPAYGPQPSLRLIAGPHVGLLAAGALELLLAGDYQVSPTANRQGYRLEGPRLGHAGPTSIASLGVVPGVIQVPPDGQPILLMADAQTTGGYPIVGCVISADLPLAAQLLPGDRLRFALSDADAAQSARAQIQQWLAAGVEHDQAALSMALAGTPG